jgi:GH43 family beta-xylosidase
VIARVLLAGLCALLLAAPAADAAGLRNPLVPETATGDDTPDPWIFRHAGRYWLTYTSTDHIEVRSARSLADLADARPTRLWPPAGQTEPEERCCALWAPEIHRVDGRWYVYYAANGPTGDTHRMYVLESETDSPAGPYRFKGRLDLPQPFAIDGTVTTIGGRTYLIYSGGAAFTPTSLYIVALSNPWTVDGEPLAISSPTLPWEQGIFAINEGPEVLRHRDRLHVIYSASWCGSKAYTLGRLSVPTGADLLSAGTWQAAKAPQPVFATSTAAGVFGPGHGSFFRSPDGRQSWMAYHATEEDKGCFTGGLRTTRVQPFTWNADGTPDFATPVSLRRDVPAPGGDATIAYQLEGVARGGRAVSDRHLVGYRGQAYPAGRVTVRLRVAGDGRYAIALRRLDASGAVRVERLPSRLLRAGTATLQVPGAGTLDQITLTRLNGRTTG